MILEQYSSAIVGGLLIGLSASLMLLFNGKIAGVSGIFWRSITKHNDGSFLFILGLPIGAWLFHTLSGQAVPAPDGSFVMAALGGILVGIGVKVGSGCTSGHGVCGISRLSKRSIVATGVFMATGILTVFVMRQLLS